MTGRLGAYVLPGDPVWLERTLRQYYPLLDDLVVPVPRDGRGWSGVEVPVAACLSIIRATDVRGIARELTGTWTDRTDPLNADTAQRQFALAALADSVDWVLQLDADEYLPRPEIVQWLIRAAERASVDAAELPMRVLFRRTRRHVFEVAERDGTPHHEYPGPVLVRPSVTLVNARRTGGPVLRVVCDEAASSLEVAREPTENEVRMHGLAAADAVIHNSWARTASETRQKVRSWGHSRALSPVRYFWLRWWPTPVLWWAMRDFHPFSRGLWPRLRRIANEGVVADDVR